MIPAVMPTYRRSDIALERGEGTYVYDTEGRRYLDFLAGIAVNALGHAHPHLVDALTRQARELWHTSNIFRIPGQERLAQRLVEATFADTVFFANSGAEAVECGIKMIRKFHDETGNPDRYRIICVSDAFHGRTLTTIFAAGQEKLVKGFGPPVPGFDHVAFGNLNELRAAITDESAGILIEPVQGEGGIRTAADDYLRGLRRVAEEFGLLLMYDEVQCGVGRTGRLFYHEWADAPPDIMAIAKGIGGGFPVGACLATGRAAEGMTVGSHGSTFGGNPLAMAVGNAVLDVVLADGFLDRVRATADALWRRLEEVASAHPKVFTGVHGMGLMIGLGCAVPNTDMIQRLREAGLLVGQAGGNMIRLLPPLIIDEVHAHEAAGILDSVARAWKHVA